MTTETEGFTFSDAHHVVRLTRWSPALEEALAAKRVEHVVVDEAWEPASEGFARLAALAPRVETVTFYALPRGWEVLYELPSLRKLWLGLEVRALEWSRLTALREACLSHKGAPGGVARAPGLERLLVSLPVEDLGFLAGAESLTFLNVVQCARLRTVRGILG